MRVLRISRIKKLTFAALIIFILTKYAALPIFKALKSGTCHSVENVLFLKTHKTGGSSIANILLRFAKTRDLTVALPRKQIFSFYWPWSFQVNFVGNLPGNKPNILCSHARYNQTTMRLIMPSDTKFITILRHPVSRFESAFLFEDFPSFLGISGSSNPLYQFLQQIDKFKPEINTMYTLRNGMSFDLGLEPEEFDNTEVIKNFITSVEKDFELVLIMEYFDESLILLKQLFCWSLDDIFYLKHNSRLRSLKKHRIPRQFRNTFLEWNKADVLLYQHFNQTFWKKVNSKDENFWSEVKLLKQKSLEMEKECLSPGEHRDHHKKSVSKLLLNPKVAQNKKQLCRDLVQDEDAYFDYFRGKQTNEQ
ncbi:galactosylceramide sulfotransferase-like [Orbicella faveolata]|uniref:galactosylceramide sulfotransferase-like n=1 Tax=Orbicella faveolata TaxID=48498 RepID=UPI0009E62F54|nr:galactosylceramide sulfotransferase-like [Orbicella faveolata]